MTSHSFQIKQEPADADMMSECCNEIIGHNNVFTYKEEDVKIEIKLEDEELCETFENIYKEEYMCGEEVTFDNESNNEVLNDIKQRSIATLSCCKDVVLQKIDLSKYKTQDYYKQLPKAQTTKDNENDYAPIKERNIYKNENNMLETLTKSARTIEAPKYKNITTNNLNMRNPGNSHKNSVLNYIKKTKKSYTCDMCNKLFQLKSTLLMHILNHSKLFNCSYCSYKACRIGDLNKHVNAVHTKNASFNCSHCSFKTYRKSNLSRHVKATHIKNTSFNCPYCTYKTYYNSDLGRHINAAHTERMSFSCSYCSYKTSFKNQLTCHIKKIHTKSSSFNCSYCSFKTYNKQYIKRHVNSVHTKSVSYDCSHCSYKTYLKSSLTRHVKTLHMKS